MNNKILEATFCICNSLSSVNGGYPGTVHIRYYQHGFLVNLINRIQIIGAKKIVSTENPLKTEIRKLILLERNDFKQSNSQEFPQIQLKTVSIKYLFFWINFGTKIPKESLNKNFILKIVFLSPKFDLFFFIKKNFVTLQQLP